MSGGRWRRRPVLWRWVGEELVVLDPAGDDAEPVRVSAAGAALWDALATPATVDELGDRLAAWCGPDERPTAAEIAHGLAVLADVGAVEPLVGLTREA